MSDAISCACLSATENVQYVRDAVGNIPLEAFIAIRDRCSAAYGTVGAGLGRRTGNLF
jgi:hypothetical protein